jgi:hypothetical protein
MGIKCTKLYDLEALYGSIYILPTIYGRQMDDAIYTIRPVFDERIKRMVDWLLIVLLKIFFYLRGDVTITGEGLQNLGLCSGAQVLWAERDLYRATLAVTRGLVFSGLIRRTFLFSRLLQHTRGIYSKLDHHGSPFSRLLRHARDTEALFLARSSWVYKKNGKTSGTYRKCWWNNYLVPQTSLQLTPLVIHVQLRVNEP